MVFITFSDALIMEPRKGAVTLRLNTNFPPKVGSLEKAATGATVVRRGHNQAESLRKTIKG